jgi:predicted MPP superfamily phosphohydrolase
MDVALFCLLIPFAALGHFAATVWLFNRLHAEPWPYRFRQVLERLLFVVALVIPLVVAWQAPRFYDRPLFEIGSWTGADIWMVGCAWYFRCCLFASVLIVPLWLGPKLSSAEPTELVASKSEDFDLRDRLGTVAVEGAFPNFCASLPGNQIFDLQVTTKRLRLRNLPPQLSGLRIAHLTDLHLTGKMDQRFYAEVVRLTNELKPDLIAMTGDICERTRCLPWIRPLFAPLEAPLGKFFILGNHDFLLPNALALRRELAECQFVDLAGRTERVSYGDTSLLLAGNELPWHGPAPNVPLKASRDPGPPFRLLLAHTPDLFPWAQQLDFDLMLAGHNHGGQIRLPWIGPLISPSRYGTRYASGLFQEGPTVMHVSRGVGGEHLLRWNCPPELALLVLES